MASTAIRLHFRVALIRLKSGVMDEIDFRTTPFFMEGVLYCQARNGERRKTKRETSLPRLSALSSLPVDPLCFPCSLFIAPSPLSERLEMLLQRFHSHKSVFLSVCARYAIRWIVRSFAARYDW